MPQSPRAWPTCAQKPWAIFGFYASFLASSRWPPVLPFCVRKLFSSLSVSFSHLVFRWTSYLRFHSASLSSTAAPWTPSAPGMWEILCGVQSGLNTKSCWVFLLLALRLYKSTFLALPTSQNNKPQFFCHVRL